MVNTVAMFWCTNDQVIASDIRTLSKYCTQVCSETRCISPVQTRFCLGSRWCNHRTFTLSAYKTFIMKKITLTRRSKHPKSANAHASTVFRASWPLILWPKINGLQDSWWNITMSSWMILAVVVFEMLTELMFNIPPDIKCHFGDVLPNQSLG